MPHIFKEVSSLWLVRILSPTWMLHIIQCIQFSSVQLLSHVQLFATPWTAVHQASLSITNSLSSPKVMFIESVISSNHLILCHPLLLLPPIPLSIRVFSNESALHIRWPKYWSFRFSISPSSEHPGLISFRMDWLDLLAVQGTLKNLLQHPQVKSINSLALSFLHSPTLTSIHDHRKDHSLDQTNLREIKKTLRRCRLKKDLIEARGLHLIMWRKAFSAERRNLQDLCKGLGRV